MHAWRRRAPLSRPGLLQALHQAPQAQIILFLGGGGVQGVGGVMNAALE